MRQDKTSGPLKLTGTATIPAVAIGAGATSDITGAVVGANLYGGVTASPRSSLDAGLLIAYAYVSAAGTVTIGVMNPTAGAIVPAAAIIVDLQVENTP